MSRSPESVHTSVLWREVLACLGPQERPVMSLDGAWVVDATLGAGGHTERILDAFPGVRVLGVDRDPEIVEIARERLARHRDRVRLRIGRFSELGALLDEEFPASDSGGDGALAEVAGVVADLGVSSLQLDRGDRGFSFQEDGPLDMRMDRTGGRSAFDVVNAWDEDDLADLFYFEGGERRARQVARAIAQARRNAPIRRTTVLAEIVAGAVGGRGGRVHPATRTFQAIRRAVNDEGDELLALLEMAEQRLPEGGRLAVISFHSGEDADVKRFLGNGSRESRWEMLTRKPVRPTDEEQRANRRSRSARLRAAIRRREEDAS